MSAADARAHFDTPDVNRHKVCDVMQHKQKVPCDRHLLYILVLSLTHTHA